MKESKLIYKFSRYMGCYSQYSVKARVNKSEMDENFITKYAKIILNFNKI